MYEQTDVPVFRRILWITLWFVVIVTVLWVTVWLVFFHHSPSATRPGSSSTAVKAKPHAKTTLNTTNPSEPSTNSAAAATTTPAPVTELANTGPGDIVLPVLIATGLGGALHYNYNRKKVQNQ